MWRIPAGRGGRGTHWDRMCTALSTTCLFLSLEKNGQDPERLRKHGRNSWGKEEVHLPVNKGDSGRTWKLCSFSIVVWKGGWAEVGRANWRQRVEITGQFNQVPTLPENWSGPALGTGTLAVWPAGLVTPTLVRCGKLFLLGERWTKILWLSHSTRFFLGVSSTMCGLCHLSFDAAVI